MKGLSNDCQEVLPQTILRERVMRRFKSAGHTQRFLRSSDSLRHTSALVDIGTELVAIGK